VSYKILLADDSVTVQKIITLTFSDEGVDVVTVNNGDEAISRLQYLRPELVMADVSIPGRNGYDICEFVKNHPEMQQTPVILLVPAFEPFDMERARRIGADYHLTKPFQSIRTLISTVKSLIEHKIAPEFFVAGGGPSASHNADQIAAEAAEIDPKKAKIEELIRLSANQAGDDDEMDVLPEAGIPQYVETRAAPGEGEDFELIDISTDTAARDEAGGQAALKADGVIAIETVDLPPAPCEDEDMDNILELDDVLPDVQTITAVEVPGIESAPVEELQPEHASSAAKAFIIPQSVIDEIVNRVVAQLYENLPERLAGEITRRITTENAQTPSQPLLVERGSSRDEGGLLDLD
jgi:CheY-like chemotaxis protein